MLRLLRAHGCPCDAFTCSRAAARGHQTCLQFLHEGGCPWDEAVCARAVEGGHWACYEYARARGCPCDDLTDRWVDRLKMHEILLPLEERGHGPCYADTGETTPTLTVDVIHLVALASLLVCAFLPRR